MHPTVLVTRGLILNNNPVIRFPALHVRKKHSLLVRKHVMVEHIQEIHVHVKYQIQYYGKIPYIENWDRCEKKLWILEKFSIFDKIFLFDQVNCKLILLNLYLVYLQFWPKINIDQNRQFYQSSGASNYIGPKRKFTRVALL